jgi:hemerythrin
MALLSWDDAYLVNINEVDIQHRKLFALANDVHDAVLLNAAGPALRRTLEELVKYTRYHFATEEKLMEDYRYPGLESHRLEHDTLTEQVLDFWDMYNEGKPVHSLEFLNFLKDWLVNHILIVDKKMGAYCNPGSMH